MRVGFDSDMRSHKVYSRSALPGLHQPHQQQQQQQQHQRHHQRHLTSATSCARHKASSPEMLRVSASAARHRGSSPAPKSAAATAGFRLKSIGRSRPLPPLEPLKAGHRIDPQERIFLEAAEHGDMHTVQRCLQGPQPVNVNCTNILGRSAIQVAL